MAVWLVASTSLGNIRRAYERLLWGFWDRDAGEKQRRNWRSFIHLFNSVKPFDHLVFQIARTGEIHGLATVKTKYYDDQTPIWDNELRQNRVLYPWRIELAFMIYSEKPIRRRYVKLSDYLDGYGIGEYPQHEYNNLIDAINETTEIKIKTR